MHLVFVRLSYDWNVTQDGEEEKESLWDLF